MSDLFMAAEEGVVLRLSLPGTPVSKSRAGTVSKNGQVRRYDPTATQQQAVSWAIRSALAEPVDDHACFGVVASFYMPGWQRQDVDNMMKLVLDAATGLVWADDQQVSEIAAQVIRGVGHSEARTELLVYRTEGYPHPTNPCEICGKLVKNYKSVKYRTCGPACADVARERKVAALRKTACQWCGTEFRSTKKGQAKTKYCSSECEQLGRSRSMAKRKSAVCPECKVEFSRPQSLLRGAGPFYCSSVCNEKAWRRRRAGRIVATCPDCGGPMSKKTYKRCMACRVKHSGRTFLDGHTRAEG